MGKILILDTNVLMAVSQFKIDLFSEIEHFSDYPYQLKVLDKTIEELNKIAIEQKGKAVLAAKLALELVNKKKIGILPTKAGLTDDFLLEYSQKGAVIITQDKELKKRIKEAGGEALTIRQKRKIAK